MVLLCPIICKTKQEILSKIIDYMLGYKLDAFYFILLEFIQSDKP